MSGPARLIAISAGKAVDLLARDEGGRAQRIVSGIAKQAVSTLEQPSAVAIGELGVAGDEIVDLTVHGGRDKAVYVYPSEHLAFWRTVREQAGVSAPVGPGLVGENLLLEGVLESGLFIGDRLVFGEVVLRVESARSPCHKFNLRMGFSWAAKMMIQSGYSGAYCSVERTGRLAAGEALSVRPGERTLSILESHRMSHGKSQRPLF